MSPWHGNAFSITGPLWGESTSHQFLSQIGSLKRTVNVFFVVSLNKLMPNYTICDTMASATLVRLSGMRKPNNPVLQPERQVSHSNLVYQEQLSPVFWVEWWFPIKIKNYHYRHRGHHRTNTCTPCQLGGELSFCPTSYLAPAFTSSIPTTLPNTPIVSKNLVVIDLGNGMLLIQHQAITWTNSDINIIVNCDKL